jgi:nucleotide-binding universal stress UspA family protein
MFRSMLVATDGSVTANRAVERAASLAARIGSRVDLVTAYQPLRGLRVAGAGSNPELAEWRLTPDSKADAVLEEACTTMRLAGVDATPHARRGDPADAILTLAEELGTDLVVVGNRGLSSARRYLLGNVPDKVSHHAPCSVLIVNTG